MTLCISVIIALSCFVYYKKIDKADNTDREEYKENIIMENEEQIKPVNHLIRDDITDDIRLHYYNNIKLSNKISIGDYIDIRISYGNGMDFIVLPKKKVVDISISDNNTESLIWLEVSEEEILRMSSAFVDLKSYEGSLIYGIKYLSETQNTAKANYPVCNDVRKLIDSDPNVINKGIHLEESIYRKVIDALDYMPDVLAEDTNSWGEDSRNSIDNEDIMYLD